MLLIRNQFNINNIENEILENKQSWFNEIYGINILKNGDIISFLNNTSFSEKHNFLNDMVRWIKSISSPINLKGCSFEISFIEETPDENVFENINLKGVKFVIVKYVFINSEYYVYIGNVEDTTFIKIQ